MPLHLQKCLSHTSFLGFMAALSSNVFPYVGEILHLFYSYHATTYIDHQTMTPSFWFRWWRPGFLVAGILYDVGMLAYCIYKEDVTAVLLAVRITTGMYQVSDQLWLIKHWVPFFVHKEKRRFVFLRLYIMSCIWMLVVGSTSWTGSWQERNDIFANAFYISFFVTCSCCGLWFLVQGGVDHLVKYRFHWNRNIFGFIALSGMILSIVGLIVGDGGGNNLIETLNFHSAFLMIYFGSEFSVALVLHYFVVGYEELSWKYPNPMPEDPKSSPSMLYSNDATTTEATNGLVSASNKVACDVDVPSSTIEFATTGSIPQKTVVVSPPEHHINNAINDNISSNGVEKLMEVDGKVEGDLEAARGFVSQSANVSFCDEPSVINPPVSAPVPNQNDSVVIPYQARRRNALAFDGIFRRSSNLHRNILTHQIMKVKMKRHELVCREIDKLYCVLYQLLLWEMVMWLAQIFLTLYLQSVNTPTLPAAQDGYYCQTPLENTINSAQFVNDLVFARR